MDPKDSCIARYPGRAWEGITCFASHGTDTPVFQAFIGGLSARERELLRFPPAGHPHYTEQMLALLEEQYPGWDSDEYRAAVNTAGESPR